MGDFVPTIELLSAEMPTGEQAAFASLRARTTLNMDTNSEASLSRHRAQETLRG